jgi:hypothetical protein
MEASGNGGRRGYTQDAHHKFQNEAPVWIGFHADQGRRDVAGVGAELVKGWARERFFATLPDMAAVTFDTLKFVKTLQAAGVSMPQAEAFAAAVRDSTESADLATKTDLRELELRMTVKFGAMMVVAIGVIAAIVKL